MANVTTTTAAVFIPEVWAANVYANLKEKLVMADLVTRYDSDVKNFGDTIHVPKVATVTARDKTAGSDVTYDSNTESEVQIDINTHKYHAKVIEDIAKVQSRYDLRSVYEEEMGHALANAVDTDLTGLRSDVTTNTVSAGSGVTDANIISAQEKLDVNDVPREGRSFVIHPEAHSDIMALDKFTRYDAVGKDGVQDGRNNGMIANAYGTDIFMTTNVEEVSGTPNLLHNLLFHKSAFALAMQQEPKMESEYSVDKLGTKVAAHTIYGVKTLDETRAVDVQLES